MFIPYNLSSIILLIGYYKPKKKKKKAHVIKQSWSEQNYFQERWHILEKICLGDLTHCSPDVIYRSHQSSGCQWRWYSSLNKFHCVQVFQRLLKAGHDIALRAVKTLAESGSLRVIFNLVHLNVSWIPSLSTLPLICITLCGHIILAHYAKNNVDNISLAQNMQSWHIPFENQGN